ncbi:MAG TPA: SMC-Scp complex subunit ScpB [bacterium]|nr:SMC-Scp complex subunit ScpB [bacterium]
MERNKLKSILEAMIFASDTPLSMNQIRVILEEVEKADIDGALAELAEDLKERAFFLKKAGGGYQFATRPEYFRWIKQMFAGRERNRLTRAALETLSIIAFKQPISRVEVAAIRGVNSDGVMQTLLERKLISITGRDEGQGRALLFSTTKEFLIYFGIDDISDLPKPKEIEELLAMGEGQKAIREIPEEEILAREVEEEADAGAIDGEPAPPSAAVTSPPAEAASGDVAEPPLDSAPAAEGALLADDAH